MTEHDDYDEFGMLGENAAEACARAGGHARRGPPVVRGGTRAAGQRNRLGRQRSSTCAAAWRWAERAHLESVALALGRPAVAIDLPGHGHSDWRPDRDYGPWRGAEAVASVIDQVAPRGAGLVGMSLGGLTAIRLAAIRPDLVRRVVIVDVTPQVNDPSRVITPRERGAVALIGGPPAYESFDAMAAAAATPGRRRSAVERGVRHNAKRLPDGRWRSTPVSVIQAAGSPSNTTVPFTTQAPAGIGCPSRPRKTACSSNSDTCRSGCGLVTCPSWTLQRSSFRYQSGRPRTKPRPPSSQSSRPVSPEPSTAP